MDDYTYIPEPTNDLINEIQDEYTEKQIYSTSIQELDELAISASVELPHNNVQIPDDPTEQLRLRNSQYDYTYTHENPTDDPILRAVNPVRQQQLPQKIPQQSQKFTIQKFCNKIANSYIDIMNDMLNGNINIETFTKESRVLAMAVLMLIISVFFIFFQQIE